MCSHRARRLARNRDFAWVATERHCIGVDPLECRNDIGETKITGALPFPGQLRVGEKAENPETIVEIDHYDALSGHRTAVIDGHRAGP